MKTPKLHSEKHRGVKKDFTTIEKLILNENGENGLLKGRGLIHEVDYKRSMMLGINVGIDTTQFTL